MTLDLLVVKNFKTARQLVTETGYSITESHRKFDIYTKANSFVAIRKAGLLRQKVEIVKGKISAIDFRFDGMATLRADLERITALESHPKDLLLYAAAGGILGPLGSALLGESGPPPTFSSITGAVARGLISQSRYRKKTGGTGLPKEYAYGPMAIRALEIEKAYRMRQ